MFPGLPFVLRGFLPAALIFGMTVFCPVFRTFVVEEAKSGRIVFIRSFEPGYEFSLSYIHSVNKSKIVDRFSVGRDGTITLEGSVFFSFGAGVATEDSGQFSGKGGALEYSGIGRVIPDLRVFTGVEAEHRFYSRDEEFRFLDRTSPGSGLRFGVRRASAGDFALYRTLKGVLYERRPSGYNRYSGEGR